MRTTWRSPWRAACGAISTGGVPVRRWLVLAATFLFLSGLQVLRADTTQTVDFTVTVTSGSESGDVFTGSYSFDTTTLVMAGIAPLTTFTFTDPAFAGDSLSTGGFLNHEVDSTPTGLNIFFVPGVGTDDAFSIQGAIFNYGTTEKRGLGTGFVVDGEGTVTYSTAEPRTIALLGLGLVGLIGVKRIRFRFSNPRDFNNARS